MSALNKADADCDNLMDENELRCAQQYYRILAKAKQMTANKLFCLVLDKYCSDTYYF